MTHYGVIVRNEDSHLWPLLSSLASEYWSLKVEKYRGREGQMTIPADELFPQKIIGVAQSLHGCQSRPYIPSGALVAEARTGSMPGWPSNRSRSRSCSPSAWGWAHA